MARFRRWIRAHATFVDFAVLALLALAMVVAETGGFRYRLGILLSIKRTSRVVIVALALWAVRWWAASDLPLFGGWLKAFETKDTPVTDQRSLGARGVLVAAAAAVLLTIVMTWPQAGSLQSLPDLGDPLFSTWRLAWVAHQLPRAPIHLFDANIYYPERGTFAYSDPTMIPALIAAPLIWLGATDVAAYNIVFLASFALTALFTFLFVRALVGRTDAAVIAAIIFAFYPYRFEQYSHLEQVTFWVPLGAWAFHRTLERGRLRDGLLTGAAIAAQFLTAIYHALFFVAFLVPVALVIWWAKRPPLRALAALGAGALLAVVLMLPVALPLFRSHAAVGERPAVEVMYYSATAANYLMPHPRSSVWGWRATSFTPERCLFPGILPIALALIGLWPPLSAVRVAYLAALAFAFDLSLGFNGLFYQLLYEYVLPYRGLRVPARMGMFVGFALAVCAAYGVKRIATAVSHSRVRALLIVVVALLVLTEVHASLGLTGVWSKPPDAYQNLQPAAVLAEFPAPAEIGEAAGDARYMYFSTFHWRRMLNGYSGFFPESYLEFMTRMRSFPEPESIAYLASRRADYIIVHGAFMDAARYADVCRALDSNPALALAQRFRWEEREGSVYRLIRAGTR